MSGSVKRCPGCDEWITRSAKLHRACGWEEGVRMADRKSSPVVTERCYACGEVGTMAGRSPRKGWVCARCHEAWAGDESHHWAIEAMATWRDGADERWRALLVMARAVGADKEDVHDLLDGLMELAAGRGMFAPLPYDQQRREVV